MILDKQNHIITATLTRPANTTQYTADDAVSNSASAPVPITFSNCARRKGGSGRIRGIIVIDGAGQATLPDVMLYIFDTSPTATNDNSEFNLTDANALTLVCSFDLDDFADLDPTSGANGNASCETKPMQFEPSFVCGTTSKNLYGLLKIANAYTPVSGEVFTFRLHVEQD